MPADAPWICMDCAACGPSPGDCASCGEGPLLDLRDPLVRGTLLQQDAERARARGRLLLGVASAIAAVGGFPLMFVLGEFLGVGAIIALGAGAYALLRALFPYRARFAAALAR
jgi:hypothetical protein